MPDSVYGQPGTKAIFEIGPEWHWELHRKPPDGRKRPLTSLQWHCWSRFQTLAKSLNVKVTLTGFGDNGSIFEIKNKTSKKKIMCPAVLFRSWDQLSHILLFILSIYGELVRRNITVCHDFIGLSFYCHGPFWINVVTHLYDFLSSQLVIWGTDVGDLHLRGFPVPWHSCWRALQVAQRGTSHGQAWQLHQRAVRIFPCFNQNFHQICDSGSSRSTRSSSLAAVSKQ